MKVQEKTLWKNWADELRQEMMTGLTLEVTKTVDDISAETASTKGEKTLHSARFWKACQTGDKPNDFLARAGFDLEFEPDDKKQVHEVTLKLNKSWSDILNRVIERQKK